MSPDSITVDNNKHSVTVIFTPTIAHCSMCMLIGLSIKTKLQDVLPPYTKLLIQITAGSHDDEESGFLSYDIFYIMFYLFIYSFFVVNKQLADKERVAAAMENSRIAAVVHSCCTYNPNVDDYGNDIIIWSYFYYFYSFHSSLAYFLSL